MLSTDSTAIPPLLRRLDSGGRAKAKSDAAGQAASDSVHLPAADSLHAETSLPGLLRLKPKKEFRLTDVDFRNEGYFKGSQYFRPGLRAAHSGVLGDPAPYSVSNDNTVAGLLLGCFALALVAASLSRNFIIRQVGSLFRIPRNRATMAETSYEVRFQLFLVVQTALILSIVYYLYNRTAGGNSYIMESQLEMIGIYFGIFMGYFLAKYILYSIVNWVYFSRNKCLQWMQSWLFLTSMEGVLLFPLVLLLVYFNLSMQISMIYLLTAILLIKILAFYKEFVIFFKRTSVSLQIILYFCALELMPLTALVGVLTYTGNYLTINF